MTPTDSENNPITEEGILYRAAGPGDGPELARLRWQFSSPQNQAAQSLADFRNDFVRDFFSPALASGDWQAFVAEDSAGRLVGNVFLQVIHKIPRPGRANARFGYVTNVYMEESLRSRGLGAHLMEMLIDYARTEGLEFLMLWPSERAVPFYLRLGFQPARRALELHFLG